MKYQKTKKITFGLFSGALPIFLGMCLAAQAATTNSWISSGNGAWNSASDWDPAEVPNGVGSMAIITNTSLGASTLITSDLNITLGSLEISGASSYHFTITNEPGVAWRMENDGQGVFVTEKGPGTSTTGDRIWVPIELAEDLTVYSAAKAVTFSGPITESGGSRKLIKTGSGYATLGSTESLFAGGVQVKADSFNAPGSSSTSKVGTGPITVGAGSLASSAFMGQV